MLFDFHGALAVKDNMLGTLKFGKNNVIHNRAQQ
jgi:hypothetical protein